MSSSRSAVAPTRIVNPSAAAHQFDKIAQELEALRYHFLNRILGRYILAPTSASTQATGAAGITVFNVNIDRGVDIVNGVADDKQAVADSSIHSATVLLTATGQTCIAALVAYESSGATALLAVKGTVAATASAVAPTKAVIQAAVDVAAGASGVAWVKIGETTLTRTGDTTVTQTYDSAKRPLPAVTVDTGLGDWSAFA